MPPLEADLVTQPYEERQHRENAEGWHLNTEIDMQCPTCKTAMLIRQGKFGPFYYCPNGNHGTISVVKYEAITKQFMGQDVGVPDQHDPLMVAIERQTMALSGGIMSSVERFYIDSEAYHDDPEDFWENVRPY